MEQVRSRVSWARRTVRGMQWLLAGVAALAVVYIAVAPTGRYLARAAWEEAGILLAAVREPGAQPADLAELRDELLAGSTSFEEVLTRAKIPGAYPVFAICNRVIAAGSGHGPDRGRRQGRDLE
jgi:hypothetical protein